MVRYILGIFLITLTPIAMALGCVAQASATRSCAERAQVRALTAEMVAFRLPPPVVYAVGEEMVIVISR